MTEKPAAIAVLDIGKSNAKLALIDRESGAMRSIRTMKNVVRAGPPYPHFDVETIWAWLIAGLAEASAAVDVEVIAVTTHGAAITVLDEDGLVLPVLDYEYPGPDSVADAYRAVRGDFAEILSPDLPGGLNAGRQLFWLARSFPEDFGRATTILPYPQYWVWRLTGRRVAEPTSFGAHSDLWNAGAGIYSGLAIREGWTELFPPQMAPWDEVGPVLADIAEAARLPARCRVVAGIHDSNASLLPHILSRPLPFAVISTGTWMITFAAGGSLDRLDQTRGGLAYVDAFARPVPSTMSMTGREFEILTAGRAKAPTSDEIARVIAEEIMALPGFVPGAGPYGQRQGRWTHDPESLTDGERTTAASLYAALVADTSLRLAGAEGPVLIEGPLAKSPLFLSALAALVDRSVIGRPDATGTTEGAALLADGPEHARRGAADPAPAVPLGGGFPAYAAAWRTAAGD
ncbi:Sugar (pentulose or hexulose) kinase [Kaistia soli DSM 19436]|uniref:Sugar (Pentulose or hexulose) kinase n=1 Tax=Kaistia soli DSM 19436 TaxID=1122133 RepID=A0A1M4Z6L8_9HYPH|nr:FGGY family carbohydrate kinase [Kaistia soli]SHF13256.1 Sugar (pentulose or hexulose) kinase [Kaistia soli DSM 19436]